MRAKKLLANLAVFLLSGFIIAYIIIQLVSGLTTDVSYGYATKLTTEDTIQATGYIFRREQLLTASAEGVVNYSVDESEKIAVNKLVATVYSSGGAVDIQNKINQIDDKIEILERSAIDTSYLTSDISRIDSKIYSYLTQIKKSVYANELSLASQSKKDLLINFNKRHLITNNASGFQNQIDTLKSERDALTSSLNAPLASVVSPCSGYFSTLLDGYENVFLIDQLAGMTVDSFNSLLTQQPQEYQSNVIGKVITDFDWYTVCAVDKTQAEDLKVGHSYPISYVYSSGERLEGFLDRKITQTDTDTVVLVFRIEQVPLEFDYARQQTVKVIKNSYTGLSVPKSALRIVDGQSGVYILNGNTVAFRKVEIIHTADNSFICKTFAETDTDHADYLSKFDLVVTAGKDLYVGKILD